MITWQDPVAMALAALIIVFAWWWRRALIRRGEGTHCSQCTLGDEAPAPRVNRPTVIDVSNLRLGRKRQ